MSALRSQYADLLAEAELRARQMREREPKVLGRPPGVADRVARAPYRPRGEPKPPTASQRGRIPARLNDAAACRVASILHLRDLRAEAGRGWNSAEAYLREVNA